MITFSKLGRYGRLGNQLWQIASTIGIADRLEDSFVFPEWQYSGRFTNPIPQTNENLDGYMQVQETPNRDFSANLMLAKLIRQSYPKISLEGYYQNPWYFEYSEQKIRHYFDIKGADYSMLLHTSIHVRRGDYLGLSHIHTNYGIDWYRKAMSIFPAGMTFFVFSDDIEWCRDAFSSMRKLDCKIFFHETSDELDDLHMMSRCQCNIITNSSFSWWAAYLNRNPNKIVVAPKKWTEIEEYNPRLPDSWIAL